MCTAWPCCDRRYNVRCYDADGHTRWVRRFESPHPAGGPRTIAVDEHRVYVGGEARDDAGVLQFSLRCYARATGETLWTSNAALWPVPVQDGTVPTPVVDITLPADGLLHVLPLELNLPVNPRVHTFDPATGAVLDRRVALTITPEPLVAERFLAVGGDGRSYHSAAAPNTNNNTTTGIAALSDGKLVIAGTNARLGVISPDRFPLAIVDDFNGVFWLEQTRRHVFVAPDGPASPDSYFEQLTGVCVDGSDRITVTGGPIWTGVGTEGQRLGQFDRALTRLWTVPGDFSGPLGCSAGGRIAALLHGRYRQVPPPVDQGPRWPSLAVLTADGTLEWSHYHGDAATGDVAVAADGWVATCGPLRTFAHREWDFLNALEGT